MVASPHKARYALGMTWVTEEGNPLKGSDGTEQRTLDEESIDLGLSLVLLVEKLHELETSLFPLEPVFSHAK